MSAKRILIYEPDSKLANWYKENLQKKNYWVVTACEPNCAIELFEKQLFHVCLWSAVDPGDASVIFKLRHARTRIAMVALLCSGDPATIVTCMRAGASNVWLRSEQIESLFEVVEETLSRTVADPVIEDESILSPFPNFIGRHPRIVELFQLIMSIRNSESTVLITGESGTGKEVVARAIHEVSPRNRRPWMAVNCGAIPGSLLESELFGHVKGAFTGATQNRIGRFQLAGNGTLFLDEISDLSFDLQAKILRAIQNKVFEPVGSPHTITLEARVIAATNQDLEKAVAEKRFREDLYYRLNVIPIHIIPLRSRKTDIPLLVRNFLERFCKTNGKPFRGISEEAMQCLVDYNWPGNVRELENLIERVVVLKREDGIVELKDLPVTHFKSIRLDRFVANVELPESGIDFNEAVNEFENELILQALQKTSGNKNQAASLLNLNRTTLVEKLKRKGLTITV